MTTKQRKDTILLGTTEDGTFYTVENTAFEIHKSKTIGGGKHVSVSFVRRYGSDDVILRMINESFNSGDPGYQHKPLYIKHTIAGLPIEENVYKAYPKSITYKSLEGTDQAVMIVMLNAHMPTQTSKHKGDDND